MRRLAPDPVQLQVIVGSLLGNALTTGSLGARRLTIAHAQDRYARWKHERLGGFAAGPPVRRAGRTCFLTIIHPIFDDLAQLDRSRLLQLVGPLGLAVWLTDSGRIGIPTRSARSSARGRPRVSGPQRGASR